MIYCIPALTWWNRPLLQPSASLQRPLQFTNSPFGHQVKAMMVFFFIWTQLKMIHLPEGCSSSAARLLPRLFWREVESSVGLASLTEIGLIWRTVTKIHAETVAGVQSAPSSLANNRNLNFGARDYCPLTSWMQTHLIWHYSVNSLSTKAALARKPPFLRNIHPQANTACTRETV